MKVWLFESGLLCFYFAGEHGNNKTMVVDAGGEFGDGGSGVFVWTIKALKKTGI